MTGQNKSTAVMQRRVEAHDSLDDYPTPPWATRAICDQLIRLSLLHRYDLKCREPCANRGYMVRPLQEYFGEVEASDVHDYGVGYSVSDYLFGPLQSGVDWTFMNPPFRLAQQFIERAIQTSKFGVAAIVRTAFLEGGQRFEELFNIRPPSHIFQHSERVPMVRGRYDPKISTATAYAWLIWDVRAREFGTKFHWIEPCKNRFVRDGDST